MIPMHRLATHVLVLVLGLTVGAAAACTPAQVHTTQTAIAYADSACILVKAASDSKVATLVCEVESALSPIARSLLEQRAAKLEQVATAAQIAPSSPPATAAPATPAAP